MLAFHLSFYLHEAKVFTMHNASYLLCMYRYITCDMCIITCYVNRAFELHINVIDM